MISRSLAIGLLLIAAMTTGCASLRHPLATCDGHERRPLNTKMWSHNKRADLGGTSKPCGRTKHAFG